MNAIIPIAILVAIVWVIFSLPARKQRRAHAEMQDSVDVGDEIISAGGIHGTIREAGAEDVRVEIAPGVVVTLDRRAVAAVAQEDAPEDEPAVDEPEPVEPAAPEDSSAS